MAQRLAEKLAAQGHTVEVWTARRTDAPAIERPRPGLTVRRWVFGIPWGPLFGVSVFLETAWEVWRARKRFDVLHSHQTSWGALGSLAVRRLTRLPMVIRTASSGPLNDVRLIRGRKGGKWLVRLLGRADRMVALCRAARDEVLECAPIEPRRVTLVPNGVDLDSFREMLSGRRYPDQVLYVGRFHSAKGVDILLRAFARVVEQYPRANLTVVGDGTERADLEALAREAGLRFGKAPGEEGTVHFAGMQKDPLPYYAGARVVALPSRTEGMSNVMVEAMAAGRAVVAAAVGGNSDLLDPEGLRSAAPEDQRNGVFVGANGILVPAENPEALAAGILRLLEHPGLAERLEAAARRHIEAHCTLDAVANRYLEIYNEAAAEAERARIGGRPASEDKP